MKNWKRAVIFGSLGAGAFFLLTGRRPAGTALTAAAALVLASEYPEQMKNLWRRAPELLEKSNEVVAAIARISERIAENSGRGGWRMTTAERA